MLVAGSRAWAAPSSCPAGCAWPPAAATSPSPASVNAMPGRLRSCCQTRSASVSSSSAAAMPPAPLRGRSSATAGPGPTGRRPGAAAAGPRRTWPGPRLFASLRGEHAEARTTPRARSSSAVPRSRRLASRCARPCRDRPGPGRRCPGNSAGRHRRAARRSPRPGATHPAPLRAAPVPPPAAPVPCAPAPARRARSSASELTGRAEYRRWPIPRLPRPARGRRVPTAAAPTRGAPWPTPGCRRPPRRARSWAYQDWASWSRPDMSQNQPSVPARAMPTASSPSGLTLQARAARMLSWARSSCAIEVRCLVVPSSIGSSRSPGRGRTRRGGGASAAPLRPLPAARGRTRESSPASGNAGWPHPAAGRTRRSGRLGC